MAANRTTAYAIIHLALRLRSDLFATEAPRVLAEQAAVAAETHGGIALMRLTSCLNESQLLPLLVRSLKFAGDIDASRVDGVESVQHGCANATSWERASGQILARRVLPFYRMLTPSQTQFAALYGPIFALGLPLAVQVCTQV